MSARLHSTRARVAAAAVLAGTTLAVVPAMASASTCTYDPSGSA